jgi:hypothetical protein
VEELEAVNQRVSQVAKEMATKEAERAQLAAEVEALNKNIRVSVGQGRVPVGCQWAGLGRPAGLLRSEQANLLMCKPRVRWTPSTAVAAVIGHIHRGSLALQNPAASANNALLAQNTVNRHVWGTDRDGAWQGSL